MNKVPSLNYKFEFSFSLHKINKSIRSHIESNRPNCMASYCGQY